MAGQTPSTAAPLPAHTPDERAAWIAGLQHLRDAVDAAMLTVVADFDAAGDGEVLHGAANTTSWLRGAIGLARWRRLRARPTGPALP